MTRIGDGRLTVQKNYEVVDDLVYEAINHISRLAKKRNVKVSVPEEVVPIMVDGKLIVQVLVNLLDNAIKHTYDNCNILLRVYTKDKVVVFEVEDNGPGIDTSIKDSIFDSFVTSSSKIIDGKRGMGLGLSICKSIVEAHNGSISYENIIGGGTLFRFALPLTEAF